jgi:hypothetical protein
MFKRKGGIKPERCSTSAKLGASKDQVILMNESECLLHGQTEQTDADEQNRASVVKNKVKTATGFRNLCQEHKKQSQPDG